MFIHLFGLNLLNIIIVVTVFIYSVRKHQGDLHVFYSPDVIYFSLIKSSYRSKSQMYSQNYDLLSVFNIQFILHILYFTLPYKC